MNAAGIVRQTALSDLVILAPFAIPGLAPLYLDLWFGLDGLLGGGGIAPDLGPTGWLLVNLFGLFAVWSAILRLMGPTVLVARRAALAKLVAAIIIAVGLMQGAAPVFALPLAADLGAAVFLAWGGWRGDREIG
ncbi:hypothetical protein [Niveispirillum sp. KHB5.9]|uniref:hypothetical protein n=1 Tax=Niveispirillum sp. KHB5.9 TaxID=3400269 RepID=UPI003A84A4E1